jgi:hypothetical protein
MARDAIFDPDCIITSCGVDWVTLTTTAKKSKVAFWRYFNHIAAEDLQAGYKLVNGGAYGFYGKRARHALIAEKEERMMLQVSGKRAQGAPTLCYQGDNCTRIDIQITFKVPDGDVSSWLFNAEKEAREHVRSRGKPPKVAMVVSNAKAETVYIGSRASEVFIRLYDKYAECEEEWARGCVRAEVEIKGNRAKALWAHLYVENAGTLYLLQCLLFILTQRGITLPRLYLPTEPIYPSKETNTKESVSLAWLATQVAPTVKRLTASMGWQTVMHTLFRGTLTDNDWSSIMNAWSLQWGD